MYQYRRLENVGDWSQEGDFVKGIKITVIGFFFVMSLSMLGNALLIAIVYKNAHQRMRSPSNYFTFNMACADGLLTVYAVPVSIVDTAYSHQWLITGVAGELLCRLSLTVFYYRIYFVFFFFFFLNSDETKQAR